MTDPLVELALLGGALGGVRWVQGPGGNVSVKTDAGELWVKASGKALADVALSGGHAKASLAVAKRALDGDEDADRELFARRPRPSLETYFHALGGRVVAHTHPVGSLLYACSSAPLVVDVRPGVVSIPYVRPGRGVALAIREVMDRLDGEGLVVLRGHGVVAYADTAARAVELTVDYDEEVRARSGPLAPFEPLVASYLATTTFAVEGGVARALPHRAPRTRPPRYLIPDAVVCASTVIVPRLVDPFCVAARTIAVLRRAAVITSDDGARLVVARTEDELRQSTEVLAAHDWLEGELLRLGAVQYLPDDEPAQILGMPSEQFRLQLVGSSFPL